VVKNIAFIATVPSNIYQALLCVTLRWLFVIYSAALCVKAFTVLFRNATGFRVLVSLGPE
jgi:hypothetical protein